VRIALRELVRRPGRFIPVGGALTLLVVLLVILGGFLDGLALSQTGAYRAQGERLWVLTERAELQLARSVIDAETAAGVSAVDGIAATGGLAAVATTASSVGTAALVDVVLVGYEEAGPELPAPPADGQVVMDRRLTEVAGVQVGDTLAVGPAETPLQVVAAVDDLTQGAPTLWVAPGIWRGIAAEANPGGVLPPGSFQALLVTPSDGQDPLTLARRIDAVIGTTQTVDLDGLVAGQPVVVQQSAVFSGIIAVTFVVTLLVVALFFALLALERVRLYAVLKAIGARTGDLVRGVAVQALGISLGAVIVGGLAAFAIVAALPADLPVRLEPARLAAIAGGTLTTAVVGGLLTLRRILAIDPAASIG
jgi:putative ABC transport system permease protein